MPKSPEFGPSEETPQEESRADRAIRELMEKNKQTQDDKEARKEEIVDEYKRLKEILKTRSLTDDERKRFNELT
ncbi:MAG: hypothetical protein AAB352_03035 [Patescibacteria group bacterium]